jgi:short-subunit dehydrogenase
MKKTILITGASTGVGRATALYFSAHGFNVIATMRNIDKGTDLQSTSNILVQQLDVTDPVSVKRAIEAGIAKFGSIDILVNNAGIGVLGAFEATSAGLIQRQFDTNVFGVMNTIKAILPHFRKRKQGMIINISSGVGIIPIPLQSLYDSTKFAIEGFSESLFYELDALNINVKLVLPGAIKTDFFSSMITADVSPYPDYADYHHKVLSNVAKSNRRSGVEPDHVAAIIYKAATDNKKKLRYLAGKDISLFSKVRKVLPDGLFMAIVKKNFEI